MCASAAVCVCFVCSPRLGGVAVKGSSRGWPEHSHVAGHAPPWPVSKARWKDNLPHITSKALLFKENSQKHLLTSLNHPASPRLRYRDALVQGCQTYGPGATTGLLKSPVEHSCIFSLIVSHSTRVWTDTLTGVRGLNHHQLYTE